VSADAGSLPSGIVTFLFTNVEGSRAAGRPTRNQDYESLAPAGADMTTAAMASYAFSQINQAQTELE
jgi:hypothetical protein